MEIKRADVFWRVARVAGVVLCVASLLLIPLLSPVFPNRNGLLAVLSMLLAVVTVAFAIFADSKLPARENTLRQKGDEIAANWSGDELIVGMQWVSWFPFAPLFLVYGYQGLTSYARAPVGYFVMFVVIAIWFALQIAHTWRVLSVGYALKLGPDGIRDFLGTEVAWRNVLGVDVTRNQMVVVLAVNPATIQTLNDARTNWNWRRHLWGGRPLIQLAAKKAWLEIPFPFTAPPVLYAAAKHLAQRANPAFDPDWKCQ